MTRLGPYRLERRLGAGGMAETFVAVRAGPSGFAQRVCVKRILPHRAGEPSFVAMFLDEARIQSRLRHANIVSVYDFGEHEGAYYLALELIEGVDLEALLRFCDRVGRTLSVDASLCVLSCLCRALEVAHGFAVDGAAQPIVHRDISPSNVLLSDHGEVKLTDFGIAHTPGKAYRTETGIVRGKLGYMAPEQLRAGPVDARSDVFALGVTAFVMLAGRHPFRTPEATEYEVLERVMRGERLSLGQARPDLPPALVALVDRMLAIEAADRPQSAAVLLDALSSIPHAPMADRELAELVRQARGRRERRELSAPLENDRDHATRTQVITDTGPGVPALATARRRKRALIALAAALGLAMLVSAGAVLAPPRGSSGREQPVKPSPTPTFNARPAESTPPVLRPVATSPEAPSPPAEPSAASQLAGDTGVSERQRASLRVLVAPHGEVWVDGRSLGNAPLARSLEPGSHVVHAGRDGVKLVRERVTLADGERRTLRMRLPN